ncbi:hypothetical protein [Bradyrhizobium guangzhouense]|uniref:hypothetical protein n=1 Tax=Bradyrhizobium guangzhouense TaxID=1325095 RepID=UPI0013E8C278|nr:hypothetical protein [Bradyrhizobium guangzhouense]
MTRAIDFRVAPNQASAFTPALASFADLPTEAAARAADAGVDPAIFVDILAKGAVPASRSSAWRTP